MSSPFAFGSPHIPPVPHSTPATTSHSYFLNKPRPPRPPVVNPYDKFTQPEFDEWILGITGALRKALGHESDEPTAEPTPPTNIRARPAHQTFSDEEECESEGEGVNDSLADIRTRYEARLDKGKARDPMEGPGLSVWGKGDKNTPIEIDLEENEDQHDEEEESSQILSEDNVFLDEDALDDQEVAQHLSFILPSDEEEEDELDESSDRWEPPQSSLRTNFDEDIDQREDEKDGQSGEHEHASSSGEEEELPVSDNVIEILSSEDEAEGQQGQESVSEDEYSGSEGEGQDIEGHAQEDGEGDDDSSSQEEVTDEPLRNLRYTPQGGAIQSAREGALSDREEDLLAEVVEGVKEECTDDEEEDADDEREEDVEEDEERARPSPEIIDLDSDVDQDQTDDEADIIQPPESDTSFPPHPSDIRTHVEIRNPWLGPRTYAEDYYAGGPVLFAPDRRPPNPYVLSIDDREDFLTPEVVTPTESNEREASTSEEVHEEPPHLPYLQFVHGAESRLEMPLEAHFDRAESGAGHVERHDSAVLPQLEADVGSTKDGVANDSVPVGSQDDHSAVIATVGPQKEDAESPEQLWHIHSIGIEERVNGSRSLQKALHDDGEAVHQAEFPFDEVYEEIDTKGLRECEEEKHQRFQHEGHEVMPRPTHRKIPSVTVEELTDEEATDKESSEEADSSFLVIPLGASDLDIEPVVDKGSPEMLSDGLSSHHGAEAYPITISDAAEFLTETAQIASPKSPELDVDDLPSSVEAEGSTAEQLAPLSPALLPTTVASPDSVNDAEAIEPEQQQLPTPPAELEEFSHHASLKYHLPETQPDIATSENDEAPMLEGDAVSKQDSAITLVEQSPMMEEDSPVAVANDTEKVSVHVPDLFTTRNNASRQFEENVVLDQSPLEMQPETEPAFTGGNLVAPVPMTEFVVDVVIEDVAEGFSTVLGDCQAIVEEISSKAGSVEPSSFGEQYTAGTLSEEGSVVSLSVADGFESPRPPLYTVEELVDDITDEDADGEVDPDLGGNMTQDDIDQKWDALADEIFDANLWALGEPLTSPADAEGSTYQVSQDPSTSTEQSTQQLEAAKLVQAGSQETLPGEPERPMRSAGATGDEDDIASSREPSPSPPMVEQPTRSPSPALWINDNSLGSIAPALQSSPSGSEKELYGGEQSTIESEAHGAALIEDGSNCVINEPYPGLDVDDASATIPGLMLTTSLRPLSPIPGLGARLSEEEVLEVVDGEIPGLTWSKTFPPFGNDNRRTVGAMPQRSASYSSTMSTPHGFTLPRRATEPILIADPYPYSLSTPGLGSTKDEAGDSEEEEEQDMSMSSSSTSLSLEKDSEKEIGEPALEASRSCLAEAPATAKNELNLPLAPLPLNPTHPAETNDGDLSGDADQDRDADGDLDPDFLHLPGIWNGLHERKVPEATEAPPKRLDSTVEKLAADVVPFSGERNQASKPSEPVKKQPPHFTDVATEAVAGSDVHAPNNPVVPQQVSELIKEEATGIRSDTEEPKPIELPAAETPQPTVVRPTETASRTAPSPGSLSSQGEVVAVTRKQTPPNSKRKRSLSPATPIQTDNAKSSKPDQVPAFSLTQVQNRSKRPRNALTMNGMHEDSDGDESSGLSIPSDDDSSDASSAYRLLRASSLESGSKSTAATPTLASPPVVMKAAEHFYPMLHRHGGGAKNQNRTEPSQRSTQKTQLPPSLSRTHLGEPGLPPVPFTSSSRRATRSNCRYRKISVPKEEDGPRVCFLVPGCSLGDEEVIEENEIEDLGEATYADSLRMIRDIESLDFDSYLIGVLRQLVGVDLLREQEVFYLPAPGEEPITRKTQLKKGLSDKSGLSKRPSQSGNVETSSALGTPRHSVISAKSPSSSKAPLSNAGSTSASISGTRKAHKYELESLTPASSPSHSSDEGEEPDGTERRPPKPRPKFGNKTERAKVMEQKAKSGKNAKRSRRLGSDAFAYKPQSEPEDSSADERTARLPRKSMTKNAGIKRTRSGKSFAAAEDTDGRETKKLKRER